LVCPDLRIFDWIVAENGALLYQPETRTELLLCSPPSIDFIQILKNKKIPSLTLGHAVVATTFPYSTEVDKVVQELGLNLQKIYNKESVMFLPQGVDKASGLETVLRSLTLPFDKIVGVGDAENDLTFLAKCGFSVSVANAIPLIKMKTHWITRSAEGDGVVELVDRMLQN
jgi:hydroxymethylpyrimidine pyrophosphatase-like HAD family hydrolase